MTDNRKKLIYCFVLAVFLLGLLIFSYDAIKKNFHYFRLNGETKTVEATFNTKKISDEKYVAEASYFFYVEKNSYKGKSTISSRFYRNQFAANLAIKKISMRSLPVYYATEDPRLSSLEKHFPLKETVYSLILVLGFLYFVGLGFYIKKKI